MPKTDAVEERRLIDDLVAALHRGFGLRGGVPDPMNSRSALYRANLPAFGKQPPKIIVLVLIASISEATLSVWVKRFEALQTPEIEELRRLRDENAQLRRLAADLARNRQVCQTCAEKVREYGRR